MRDPRGERTSHWRAGAFAFVVLFWMFDLAALRAGVPDLLDDSWEYGAAARALLEGHGFRTPVIHPPLWSLRDAANHVPVLVHGPLLPLLIAPLLRLFGPGMLDHVAWLGALFAIVAAIELYRLGARHVSAPVGCAAAALFTVSPLTLRAVHHDVALLAGAALLSVALDQTLRRQPRGWVAGLALGLGTLARPEFVYAAPIVFAISPGVRARFALAFVAIAAPWLWHAARATGQPFFNLSSYLLIGYWDGRPGIGVMRDFALPPRAWPATIAHALPGLVPKWIAFAPHAIKRALLAPSGATGWLAPLGVAFALQNQRLRSRMPALLLIAALPLAIMTLTLYDSRYLVPFLGLWSLATALGAADVTEWLPAWAQRPRFWIGALALLTLPSAGPALNDGWREARATERLLAAERAGLAALPLGGAPASAPVERRALTPLYSDTPDFVAWTLRAPTVWVTRAEYLALPEWNPAGGAPWSFPDRPRRAPDDLVWFHDPPDTSPDAGAP